jgi:hypothetical protein
VSRKSEVYSADGVEPEVELLAVPEREDIVKDAGAGICTAVPTRTASTFGVKVRLR